MMLIVIPSCRTAVFLARIVMPFSRSRSPESRTLSATCAPTRNAPDCQSMASTSVVLPWSTCATIATFRRSSRVASRPADAPVADPALAEAGLADTGLAGMTKGSGNCGKRQDYGLHQILVGPDQRLMHCLCRQTSALMTNGRIEI